MTDQPATTPAADRARALADALIGDLREQRDEARAQVARVRKLGDSWVGFDDSHHYGDAILKIVGGTP